MINVADPRDFALWERFHEEIMAPDAADRMTEGEYMGLRQEIVESAMWALDHQREPAAAR